MLKGMKPLPKAIVLGVVIAAPIWAYMQFAPKSAPKAPVVEPIAVETTTVPAESEAVKRAAELAQQPVQAQPAAPVAEAPAAPANVTSGDAGLKAVLGAGKK